MILIIMAENVQYVLWYGNYIVWRSFWAITFKNPPSTFYTMVNNIMSMIKKIEIYCSLNYAAAWILFTAWVNENTVHTLKSCLKLKKVLTGCITEFEHLLSLLTCWIINLYVKFILFFFIIYFIYLL